MNPEPFTVPIPPTYPLAEVLAKRDAMVERGLTVWSLGWAEVADMAHDGGWRRWLRDRGYNDTTGEAVHVAFDESREVAMILGARKTPCPSCGVVMDSEWRECVACGECLSCCACEEGEA